MASNHQVSAGEILMFGIPNRPMYNSSVGHSSSEQTASYRPSLATPPASVLACTGANRVQSDSYIDETDQLVNSRLHKQFPCNQPANPNMRNWRTRKQSFHDYSWQKHTISATPEEITEAGFYYIGESDRVKCWYCNGALENWEVGDIPFQEHAKWFPLCEFVLQQKGVDYVREIASLYPNIRRPTLYNPAKNISSLDLCSPLPYHNRDVPPPNHDINHTERPVIFDPRQNQTEQIERKIEAEMVSSEIVEQARMMAFEDNDIRYALRKQFEKHNKGFTKLEKLVDFLQENEGKCEAEDRHNTVTSASVESNSNELSEDMGLQAIRDLEESRKCRSCHREPSCMVFIPCGHLACCVNCGKSVQHCPICESRITERIRSYIS